MTRRNAFDHHDAQDPIASIPLAQGHKREDRSWDRAHHGISYFIPASLNEQAKDIRASILALAQKHMTNTTSVASALISFSLAQVRQGKLAIEARPNASRRKMTLTWVESGEWPQEIPQPAMRAKKDQVKDVYLNYRWGRDVDTQIRSLAGEFISVGEVVVFLLSYAFAAHQSGRLRLKEEAVVVSQKVSSTW